MPALLLIVSVIPLVIWIYLTFFRGDFWQLHRYDDDAAAHSDLRSWPSVVAVVPARNEAETIARAVKALAGQNYPGLFRVIVVDDHSEDGTGKLARSAAVGASAGDRVSICQAEALQPGWTGKVWAMQNGVASAEPPAPDYFWFTDADIAHAPDALRHLVSRAETQKLDLASLMVLLQAQSFPERLLIPPFLYFFLKLYPPRWLADPKKRAAGAAGGCILLRRSALEGIGGLSAIRTEVIDDCALARAVKGRSGAIWMGLTRKSVSLRSYQTFGEIRDLISRTAFTQLRYSTLVLLGTLFGMVLTYLAPVFFVFHTQPLVWRAGLATWALMTITFLPTVRFYGVSPLWAPLLPVAAVFYSYATWLSAARFRIGRGGQWKGRAQAPKRQPNHLQE